MAYAPGLADAARAVAPEKLWGGVAWRLPSPRPMPEANESELLDRAQRGDRSAFSALVRKHHRRVFACAAQMLGNMAEAEDATQETFLRAWKALPRFDRRSELSTWLYRICVNVSLNAIRKRKRNDAADIADPRVPEPAADPAQGNTDPSKAFEGGAVYGELAAALDALSPSLRTTVILVLVQGVPHKEAAQVLGCPEGTVAWRIHEARRKLREKLKGVLDEDADAPADRGGTEPKTEAS